MRLIDADYVLDVIKEVNDPTVATDVLDHIIATTPTISQWIPASERLPNEGEEVLCTHRGKFGGAEQVVEHTYLNGKFVCNWAIDLDMTSPTYGEWLVGEIIAWMPLPEPYRANAERE